MKEELYVLTSDGWAQVDLNEPSGITLNFKSNMFSDLSKITCSHTYTFKLPFTINNRQIFDFADDIRHQSEMIRKRLTAYYRQNGINLFSNANLYIESVGTNYNAVMTWDIIDGMTAIKEDDISLRELPNNNDETLFGSPKTTTEDDSFDNTSLVLNPTYNCGIPFYKWNLPYVKYNGRPNYSHYTSFAAYPMPVVPVYKILQMINTRYGTKFKLGNAINIGNAKNFDELHEVVEKGVIPLVGTGLNYEERLLRKCYLTGMKFTYVGTKIGEENELVIPDVITFSQVKCGSKNDFMEPGSLKLASHDRAGNNYDNVGVKPKVNNMAIEIDGCVQCTFTDFPAKANLSTDEIPTLSIFQRRQIWKESGDDPITSRRLFFEWRELDSIEGERIGSNNGYYVYEFDFASINGSTRLSCDNIQSADFYGTIFFTFSHRIKEIVYVQKDIEIFLKNSNKCRAPHNIDVIGNLPDIGCLTFIKSLFYMMGAFPYVNASQEIIPRFFYELKENIEIGNVLDWSDKLPGSANDLPSEIKFTTGNFSQRNYYIMKSDDLDSEYDPEDVEDDVYTSGAGCLEVDNSTLELNSTIIQLPFFSPYILNRKFPSFDTGHTIKAWTLANEADSDMRDTIYNRLEYCEPEPALGIIKDRDITEELNTGQTTVKGQVMTMEVWNGFANMQDNKSYAYMQEIIRKPFVITEEIRLTEFDLLDLDYAKPVYLNKYNSYFAIVSIKRDSKGKCKCELIKLP